MSTPIADISERNIGTVESVSPIEIKVLLDTEAPRNVSLNAGYPFSFPKINSYLLIPNETGFLVGSVSWLGVEKSAYPKRNGLKDFGLVDLPYPLRKLTLTPVGTLVSNDNVFELQIGVKEFPSVGDTVIVPSKEQVKAIVQGKSDDSVVIGTCPTAHNVEIKINPDKVFGRHLAVLGNTGGGKSCTVASLVRSAITSVKKQTSSEKVNSRFIILDPNGEYSKCFTDLDANIFKVGNCDTAYKQFKLPAWTWNGEEWCSILQASPGIQKPLLLSTLRKLKNNSSPDKSYENIFASCCSSYIEMGVKPYITGTFSFSHNNNFGYALRAFLESCNFYKSNGKTEIDTSALEDIHSNILWPSGKGYNAVSAESVDTVFRIVEQFYEKYQSSSFHFNISEDNPKRFDITILGECLRSEASLADSPNTLQNISPLISRLQTLISDNRIYDIIRDADDFSFQNFLNSIMGEKPITVIDLSLVPYEILHLVIAVTSRIVFEAHQRYKKLYNKNLPTVLVLEEAHTFVSKGNSLHDIDTTKDMCRKSFEKIAREGRKFGLGLVLSSQRPSELSETVLSQCNSFILHRISNDRDQELIKRLVPDTAHGILNDLPTLPQRYAIALGAITSIPVLIETPSLKEEERPQSDDPKFWEAWQQDNEVSWEEIIQEWAGKSPQETDTSDDGPLMG